MPDASTFTSLAFYHILSYGTLLGSQFFQTFINGPVAFSVLPRPSFATLQTGIFPVYFKMQTALVVVLAQTFPGMKYLADRGPGVQSGIGGVFDKRSQLNALLPLSLMFFSGLANTVWLGPVTTKVMKERKHQETRDGKKYYDEGPHSTEMQKLNKKFGMLHGISSLANLIGFGAAVFYGATIADMLW